MNVREEETSNIEDGNICIGAGNARKHPFPRWITSVLACFAGSIICNMLLGEPMFSDLRDNEKIAIITLVWYLIYYSPLDVVYKILQFKCIKMILYLFKEIQRVRKIHDGVTHSSHLFPGAYMLMVFLGTIKGCGTYLILRASRLFFGPITETPLFSRNFTHLSITSKASAVIATLFVCQRERMIEMNKYLVSVAVVLFMYYLRFITIFFPNHEPLSLLENVISGCLFGGWWNALDRAWKRVAKRTTSNIDFKTITADSGGGGGGSSSNSSGISSEKVKDSKKRD